MSTTGLQLFLFLFVFVYLFIGFSIAAKVQLLDAKCNHNIKYVSKSSCELSGPKPAVGVNFDMQMKSLVKDFRMDLMLFLDRGKNFMPLFKAGDIDVCTEFHKENSPTFLQIFKEMTYRAGKWPKCPVPDDFYYSFHNITPHLSVIPSFIPEASFKMVLNMKDKKEVFLSLSILGKINHSKQRSRIKPRSRR